MIKCSWPLDANGGLAISRGSSAENTCALFWWSAFYIFCFVLLSNIESKLVASQNHLFSPIAKLRIHQWLSLFQNMIQTCFKYIFEQKGKGLKVEIPPTDDVHEAVFPLMVPIQILRPLAQLWMINMMLVVPPEKKKNKNRKNTTTMP